MKHMPLIRWFGFFLVAIAGLMVLPALVAVTFSETRQVTIFLVSAVFTAFIGGALLLASRGVDPFDIQGRETMLVLLWWFFIPVICGIPMFALVDLNGLGDVYFQATSALTTTSISLVRDMADTPRSQIFWMALVNWLGGLASIISVIVFIAPIVVQKKTDTRLVVTHSDRKQRIKANFLILCLTYPGLTLVGIILLLLLGVPGLEAVCLALSAVSTGGVLPGPGSLADYVSPVGMVMVSVLMIAGAINIHCHHMAFRGKPKHYWQTRECRLFLLLVITAAIGVWLLPRLTGVQPGMPVWQAFSYAASFLSTTGFAMSTHNILAPGLLVFFLLLMFVGGTRGSCAGGMKIGHLELLCRFSHRELARLVHPRSIFPTYIDGQMIERETRLKIWVVFFLFLASITLLALILTATGFDYADSLTLSITTLTNTAPGGLHAWGAGNANPNYVSLSEPAKWAIILGMIMGRVEYLAVLSWLNVFYWLKR